MTPAKADAARPSLVESRRAQLNPEFDANELARIVRFGSPASIPVGEIVAAAGVPSDGVLVIQSGCLKSPRPPGRRPR